MELRDLQLFMCVVEQESYTKAAAVMYVSQPTLSKSIKRLEEELDVKLLHRTTRSVSATEEGLVVYTYAKRIVDTKQELDRSLQDMRDVQRGTIRIGIPPLIGTLFFPEIAKKFHQKFPQVTLELIEHGAKTIGELIHSGKVDVGFMVLPVNDVTFKTERFVDDDFVAYVHINHPLANKNLITITALQQEPFIIFSDDFALHDFVLRSCEEAGFTPKVAYKSSQWDLITELIALDLGVTILPRAIYEKQANPNVKIIPLAEPLVWRLGIVTLNGRYQSVALKEWLNLMNEEVWSWQQYMPIRH